MPYKDPIKQREYFKNYKILWRKRNRERANGYQWYYRISHPKFRKKELFNSRKWYENHPEAKLFYTKGANLGEIRMLFELGGCCVFCFNTHPSELEVHHPFGRKEFPDKRINLCHECHTLIHRKKRSENARNIRLTEWGKI
jgi:hypothetical protein